MSRPMVSLRDDAMPPPAPPAGRSLRRDAPAQAHVHGHGHGHSHDHAHTDTQAHARVVDAASGSVLLAGLAWRLTVVVPVLGLLGAVLHGSLAA